jgi:IS5 family transposase
MIDLRHPLAVLASRIPWQEIEASIAHAFAKKVLAGKRFEDEDLFGTVAGVVGGGVSPAGRPGVPLGLMIGLLYLKQAFNESDEGAVERWCEPPTWQPFSRLDYFEHRWPCDPSLLVCVRRTLGEQGVEALLSQTINVAVDLKLVARRDLATVIVDSTVQEKVIAYPTDTRCWRRHGGSWWRPPRPHGIELRRKTYAKDGRELSAKARRYADARQFRRIPRTIKRQRTIVAAAAGGSAQGSTQRYGQVARHPRRGQEGSSTRHGR